LTNIITGSPLLPHFHRASPIHHLMPAPTMTSAPSTLSSHLDKTWADQLVPMLNVLLSDFEVFRFNLRGALWNGWGEQYILLRDILPSHIEHAQSAVDVLGRRVRCLEGLPPTSIEAVLELSNLGAHEGAFHDRACMRMVRESFSHLLKLERELLTTAQHAGDEVTAGCITGLMQFQEEALWHLRSSLRRSAFETEYLRKEQA